jgi:hypothetical protein
MLPRDNYRLHSLDVANSTLNRKELVVLYHCQVTWNNMTQKQFKRRQKSWKGCTICRAAKRKCTEEQPRCAHCERNGLQCQVLCAHGSLKYWLKYDISIRFRVEEFVTENDQVVGQKSRKLGLRSQYTANIQVQYQVRLPTANGHQRKSLLGAHLTILSQRHFVLKSPLG